MDRVRPSQDLPRRVAADLREVRLALRDSMVAHLHEARIAQRSNQAMMFESVAIKRALVASAVDGVLTERRARWSNCSYVNRPNQPPPDLSATGAERRLMDASKRLKRGCRDKRLLQLADELQRASGGVAGKKSHVKGACAG